MPGILVQCVVVLYKNTLEASTTIRSLVECCRQLGGLAEQFSILIYDNSPSPQQVSSIDWPSGAVQYHHDAGNGGLAAAYNLALAMARRGNIDWLLLLDQDTVLDGSFFRKMLQQIRGQVPATVSAIVPRLVQDGVTLSPQIVGKFHNDPISPTFSGIPPERVTALNSAACVRVQAVSDVGGFPQEYWLDYLDHVMFHRLQAVGGEVFVLNLSIEHRLSVQTFKAEMTRERYANVLTAEWRFIHETGWGGGPFVHRFRLLKRALSLLVRRGDTRYALRTLRSAFNRVQSRR